MSKEQPEALPVRLAKRLCDGISTGHDWPNTDDELLRIQSAAELRRLHAENEALRAQIWQGVPDEQRMRNLLARYENQWHRMGELWERCQGKGWPEAESKEFARLRDELTPATRALLLAYTQPAPQTDRSGCTAGTDEECKHRHCATQCPKRAQIGQGEPVAWRCRVGEHPWWLEKEKPSPRLLMEIEPLYTHPAPQQKPLLDEKKIEMWTNATIECCTYMACYMRGIEDAEAAHNIGEKE